MEFILFVLMLVGFVLFYLVLRVVLLWTFIFLIFTAFTYISIAYPRGREDYPDGPREVFGQIVMGIIMWFIFIIVGPRPIPFLADTVTYTPGILDTPGLIAFDLSVPVITVSVIFLAFLFYIIFAFLIPGYGAQSIQETGASGEGEGGEGGGGGKPKVGVGSG